MAVGKIDELVSDQALAQLDALLQKLGVANQAMIDNVASAAKFNNEIGNVKTLTDFTTATQAATAAMQEAKTTQAAVAQQQKEVVVQTQAITDAVKIRVAADANGEAVLKQVGGTLDANIKLLVQQKLQLKAVTDQIKDLSSQYAGSQRSQQAMNATTVELTKQQLELKNAIAQQSLYIKQQIKDTQSATGSQDEMLARLNLLRKAYNSLSEEERNNAQVGGVMLANIKQLSAATAAINEQQGKYNDSVGRYEDAIKSAISQFVPFGNQIIKSVETFNNLTRETDAGTEAIAGLGTKFASFTIGSFAVGMAAATYYLQQFRSTGQEAEQFLGGLKNQFATFGKDFIDLLQGKKTNFLDDFKKSFNQGVDVTKAMQDIKNLNEVNDAQVKSQQALADQYRATAKDVGKSTADRTKALKEAQRIENEIITQQKDNAKQNIDAALQLAQKGVKPLLPSQVEQLQGDPRTGGFKAAVQAANDLAQAGKITEAGYEALLTGYDRQTTALQSATMKLIRQQNDESRLNLKAAKELNNDELELQKAKLTGEKDTARLILDDQKQGYDARIAALKVFVTRSNAIIDTEQTIADRAPGITGTKKKVNAQNASNQRAGVTTFDVSEQKKIQDDVNVQVDADQKKLVESYRANEKAIEDVINNSLDEQLLQVDLTNSEKILKLTDSYSKQLISEKDYNNQVLKLKKDAAKEAVDIQIEALEQILKAQVIAATFYAGDPKAAQGTAKQLTKLRIQSNNLSVDSTVAGAKGDKLSDKEKQQEIIAFAAQAIRGLELVQGLVDQNAKAAITALEQQFTLIQRNAEAEKNGVNNSILSAKEKARETAIIDAQTAQQRLQITQQENAIKTKQAEFDKAIAVSKIIEGTAVAVVSALSIPIYGEALAIVIGALGAAQLGIALATPLPKFEKGGSVSKDGHIITGEAGTELRIDPNGQYSLTADHANVTYAQAGTKIINNTDLMRIIAKPEAVHYTSTAMVDNRKLERLMAENNDLQRKQKRPIVNVHGDRWGSYSAKRNY